MMRNCECFVEISRQRERRTRKTTYTRDAEDGFDVSIGGGSLISDVTLSSDGLDTVFALDVVVSTTVLVLT